MTLRECYLPCCVRCSVDLTDVHMIQAHKTACSTAGLSAKPQFLPKTPHTSFSRYVEHHKGAGACVVQREPSYLGARSQCRQHDLRDYSSGQDG